MIGDPGNDRCAWEERVLGRPGSLRRALTIPVLVFLGGWMAYVEFDHASGRREEPRENLGAFLSNIAVPEPLWDEARRDEASSVFEDFATYREFLTRHELGKGVLITGTSSRAGVFLFHAFPPLDDSNTFSQFIASLPALVSRRATKQPMTERVRLLPLPAAQLSTRAAAEETLRSDCFARPDPDEALH